MLTLSMMVVGVGAAFVLTFWMAKLMLKIAGIGGSVSDNGGTGEFAKAYRRDSDGQYCYLWSTTGTHANIKDESGNLIEVWLHNSDGLVIDGSGNLYRPE